MSKIEGVILAGGDGSRIRELSEELRIPKHLFPIGDETSATRLARQLSQHCSKVFCVIPKGQLKLFQDAFTQANQSAIGLIEKSNSGGAFIAEFELLKNNTAPDSRLIITAGDLGFEDVAINKIFDQQLQSEQKTKVIIGLCRQQLKKMDLRIAFAILPSSFLDELVSVKLNPDDTKETVLFALKKIFRRQLKLVLTKTVWNINTPEQYEHAKTLAEI